jgi:hypothetical protein
VTSIRELLAQKQRRRLVVPIQISDPSEAQQQWMGVAAALEMQRGKDDVDDKVLENLQAQLVAAEERANSHFAHVELQSLPPAEWEAVQVEWRDDDGAIDWAQALAPLLAASSVDPELQDADYWRELMAGESWTEGDTTALRMAILQLNVYAPDARVPKG